MLSLRRIFQGFYSYKTKGTLDDVKKQTCLAVSIHRVVMIILVNWVTNFRPPKFHKSSVLTPCFQILGNTLVDCISYSETRPAYTLVTEVLMGLLVSHVQRLIFLNKLLDEGRMGTVHLQPQHSEI